MQLVATLKGKFFRAQSVTELEKERVKEAMLKDQDGLEFNLIDDTEFERWLESQ